MLSATPSLTELSLAKCRLADSHLELLVTYGWGRGGAAAGALTALSLRGNRLSAFSGASGAAGRARAGTGRMKGMADVLSLLGGRG